MKRIGFIGCGNMAGAMIGGIVGKKLVAPEEIYASNRSQGALAHRAMRPEAARRPESLPNFSC